MDYHYSDLELFVFNQRNQIFLEIFFATEKFKLLQEEVAGHKTRVVYISLQKLIIIVCSLLKLPFILYSAQHLLSAFFTYIT